MIKSFILALIILCAPLLRAASIDLTTEVTNSNIISLRWTDESNNEDGFIIERAEDEFNFSEIARIPLNQYKYIDNTVLPSKPYWYKISSFNQIGVSESSNIVKAVSNSDVVNISTRGYVGINDNVMIAGFISVGRASKFLVRGVGPTLSNFGLSDVINDPKLDIYKDNQLVFSNDNWGNDPEIITISNNLSAFHLSANSKDAAFIITLPPGRYTVIMSGVDGDQGIGLLEIYQVL